MRGRKPQTNEQKAARGETRPCRTAHNILEFPVVGEVPDPPEWLNDDGKELWNDIAPALFRVKVLTKADLYALSHLCQLHGETVDGYKRRNSPTAATLSQLRYYFAEFGMTPSSRTRIGAATDGKAGNKFKNNTKTSADGSR